MSYRSMVEMSTSPSLIDRIAACLATFHTPQPRAVAQDNIWRVTSTAGWSDAWQFAVDNYNINQNPDTGARNDVITDEMILEACSAIHEAAAAAAVRRQAIESGDRDAETAPRTQPQVVETPGVPPGQAPVE